MIEIDIREKVGFNPDILLMLEDESVIQGALSDIMAQARAKWLKLAGERLHSTQQAYLQGTNGVGGLGAARVYKRTASLSLTGVFPNMLENGASAFDMHEGMLGSGKAKVSKDGNRYRAIPMRQQTPGTVGVGGGKPMDRAYAGHPMGEKAAAKLGRKIHKKSMELGRPGETIPNSDGKKYGKYGERLKAGLAPILRAHEDKVTIGGVERVRTPHATDIFAGMHHGTRKNHGQHQTFRIISDAEPDKWLHPGLPGVHIADDVQRHIEKHVENALLLRLGLDLK